MANSVEMYFRDFDNDRKRTSVNVTVGSDQAARQAVIDGIQLWSAGANDGEFIHQELAAPIGFASPNPVAQGSLTLILEMKDSLTERIYTEKVPMPAMDKAADGDGDDAWISVGQPPNSLTVINTDHADWATLKTALDAAWLSPLGNGGTLVRGYIEE